MNWRINRSRRNSTPQNRRRAARRAAAAVLALASGVSVAQAAGILTKGGGGPAPVAAGLNASLVGAAQASAVAAQSQNELSHIATALQAMQAMQTAARNLTIAAPSAVPNGLVAGGLVPNSGLAAAGVARPVKTWIGAGTPTQVTAAGATNVTIEQTAAQAILSWNSFNVGKTTTVTFDQQGNANWVALNQIAATGRPSQILGAIKATGQVYLINPNGIIFGGSSQVNVGALVASTATLSDSQFLTNGIYSPLSGSTYLPSFANAGGDISVQAGAIIATSAPASVTDGGGDVLLLGKTVSNAGAISTPDGQAELAAGDDFLLRQGFGTSSNTTSTTRGNEIEAQLNTPGSSQSGGSGTVLNTGVITADTGDITLAGETIQQNGIAAATTSVDVRGSIHLLTSATDPFASVTLGATGLTLISPDLASTATALDSQRAGLIASSLTANEARRANANAQFNDLSLLNDQQEDSRIEIVSGGTVEFTGGSRTVTPGGNVVVSAANRIEADPGASLDVAGSYDVALPIADNDIAVNIQNYELRDNPQNRLADALQNGTVYVDQRDLSAVPASASDPNARAYTEGGLLEVSGYLNTTGHTIGEWTAIGGGITLSTGAAGSVVAQAGSDFDIAGGSIAYQGGLLPQSYLIGDDGRIYNVNDAPGGIGYAGVFGGFVEDHPRWGVTDTYADVVSAPAAIYQQGYVVGRDAGSLQLATPTSIFNGAIEAGAVNGIAQTTAAPAGVTDPYTLGQNVVAAPGALTLANSGNSSFLPITSDVTISDAAPAAAVGVADPVAAALVDTANFNAAALDSASLGAIYVLTDGGITVSAPLTLAPGGQLGLYGSSVDLAGNITAAGGAVTAANIVTLGGSTLALAAPNPPAGTPASGDIVLAPNAIISTAGLWTNLRLDPSLTDTEADQNGGAVTLTSVNNLTLGTGSLIDASAGAVLQAKGTVSGGAGGALSLTAGIYLGGTTAPGGVLSLGGQLRSVGYTKGGALTLTGQSFDISATAPAAGATAVTLTPGFFTQGFSSYTLNSAGDVNVDPGTIVNPLEPLEQISAVADQVATGSPLTQALQTVLLPLYIANPALTSIVQRAGAGLTITAAPALGVNAATQPGIDIGAGAALGVDPGQTISLGATGQITIDGALSAPGGAINIANNALATTALPDGPGGLSIFFGALSDVSVAAQPVSFTNAEGAAISLAPAGGAITIGNTNAYGFGAHFLTSSPASVIVQAGAVIDASGSAAVDRLAAKSLLGAQLPSVIAPGTAVPLEGAGGAISISSENGLFIDGTLRADAGGPDAAGGTLFLGLETNEVIGADNLPASPRIFDITQTDTATPLPADLQAGAADLSLTEGTAAFSAQQVDAGGFGALTLFSRDAFSFDGDVTLNLPQQITLEDGAITDSDPAGSVVLQAPYVVLNGNVPAFGVAPSGATVSVGAVNGYPTADGTGSFTVNAALIDILNNVRFGGQLTAQDVTGAVDLPGFAAENLDSTGAVRLTLSTYNGDTPAPATLITTGDLNIAAAELYVTGNTAATTNPLVQNQGYLVAGYDPAAKGGVNGPFSPTGALTITNPGTAAPLAPLQVDGGLFLLAPTINQGGALWQPLGGISFNVAGSGSGLLGADPNAVVNFLPGSLTSVSAAGLAIPFGGTTDGINYAIDNNDIIANTTLSQGRLAGVINGIGTGAITIGAQVTNVGQGAVLDLSGGGTLAGEGFISGESGSTDVLTTPLLTISPAGAVSQPSLATNPVYAIVAGNQIEGSAQVVTETGALGSTPAVGRQIVIPAGVPGLAAGTYTLLPAQYALTPGGYRVELDGAASLGGPAVAALPNGSYAVAGTTALANTNVRATLPTDFTITPAATTARYADYDTETYSQFLLATAARIGATRPTLPIDAASLNFVLPPSLATAINNAGTTLTSGADGGIGSIVTLSIAGGAHVNLDIYGAAPPQGLPAGSISISAAALDAFDPSTLNLGVPTGFSSNLYGVTLERGAVLKAARVTITALIDGITLMPGSEIDTLGQGTVLGDSSAFGPLSNGGASVLDVGNGYFNYLAAPTVEFSEYGPIKIDNGAKLYTDGTIALSTASSVNIGVDASYGGKYIDVAIPNINVGNPAALGAEAPPGLFLEPAVLQALTAGVPGLGVPATQILLLTASNALNFYGNAALDLSGGNVQLVINTPAIYGFGDSASVATIAANTIVWNGVSMKDATTGAPVSATPGGVLTNGAGTGAGTLDFDANTIVLGYSGLDEPVRDLPLNRVTLGFGTVNLNASTAIAANNQGTLAVYRTAPNPGAPGTGGTLNLNTPLLTAGNAATIGFTAGDTINLAPPADGASATALTTPTAGGEIDLTAATVGLDGSIILPSGKLDVQAAQNILLGAGSLVDLSGATTTIGDQTVDGFGGSLVMASADGSITQDAGSVINIGAIDNAAGSIALTTTGAAGTTTLNGQLLGAGTGGYASGGFALRTTTLADFAGLNDTLNAGGIFQSRAFEIAQGDLTIGNDVQAHNVDISVDGGSLTVTGTIDAAGGTAGAISLAAGNNLTLAASAELNAAGEMLATDSAGQPISAANAPTITLTTTTGALTLASGATLNLASADNIARGDLELNVPRLGGVTAGDADIATGQVNITGAATVAVNAFATYNGAPDTTGTASGAPDALITQQYLDGINTNDTTPFMNNAADNADLASRLAGLKTSAGGALQFRPGIDIVSATPEGDLTVSGDINLAGYRYGPGADPNIAGSGTPGVLNIRAGGDLNIHGSITDGFAAPIDDKGTEFADGWVLLAGAEPYAQSVVVPVAVEIAAGTKLGVGPTPVNYQVPITGGDFASGAVAPVALPLAHQVKTPLAFVATSNITSGTGAVLYAKGSLVPAGTKLAEGTIIGIGGTLPFEIKIGPVRWPANTIFTVTKNGANGPVVEIATAVNLLPGAYIPADSVLVFSKGQANLTKAGIATRPTTNGTQGQLYALASLLPEGDKSWSIGLAGGANTQAADMNAVQSATSLASAGVDGDITLADTHYGLSNPFNRAITVPAFSVIRTGTGTLDLVAGGDIDEQSDFGIYTAGAQSPALLNAKGVNPFDLPQGLTLKGTLLGKSNAAEAALEADYQANYPTGGGNVLVSAQGALNGFVDTLNAPTIGFAQIALTDSDAIGAWLWRQGGAGQSGAWWIEFGALEPVATAEPKASEIAQLDGFQGIGTLGGGNLTVAAGGNATGLNLVVADTGRATSATSLAQTGGGTLSLSVGGAINDTESKSNLDAQAADGGGLISDMRGNAAINAGSIGLVIPAYGANEPNDPRVLGALATETSAILYGLDLAPGDGTTNIATRGDLVIDRVVNPGLVQNQVNTTPVDARDGNKTIDTPYGGTSFFSLWSATTGVNLASAGGDVTPSEGGTGFATSQNSNADPLSGAEYYPPNLSVMAQNGDIDFEGGTIELAPAARGQLRLLADQSILGFAQPRVTTGHTDIAISGADPTAEATPFNPAIEVNATGIAPFTNFSPNSQSLLLAFAADSPSGALHAGDPLPALVEAGNGDIVNLQFGAVVAGGNPDVVPLVQYLAAKPFDVYAGRDIVASGSLASPSVFLNLSRNDVTSVTAGRDILESSFDIAGPGTLAVQAGRDIYEANQGTIYSLGPIFDLNPNDRDSGAGIAVLAGTGGTGPDYANFANLFLNPDSTLGLDNAAALIAANDTALTAWLRSNYRYAGTTADAYAYFETLNAQQRDVFLRKIYFGALNASGIEFNTLASVRYKSYILGQDAIAALFPTSSAGGGGGDITLFGNSGIHTDFGGAIETLTPTGQTVIGVEGVTPPGSAGVITEGAGDIDIYAQDSVLLGESRVLTTFGGNVLIWSADGSINAGRGSKTTIDFAPVQRVYDNYGDVFLSPSVPSSGAGIGTLDPIPQVTPGDINLVAPFGTVDAGEAGIRASGNVNIAALHVVNGNNISFGGSASGIPSAPAINVGALTSASTTAGAATQSAAPPSTNQGGLPSIWIVEVLGYGGGDAAPPRKQNKKANTEARNEVKQALLF